MVKRGVLERTAAPRAHSRMIHHTMAVLHPLSHEVDMDEQNAPRPTAVPRGVSEGAHQRPGRKHMGIATSDPTYLPPVDNPRAPASNRETHTPRRKASLGKGGSAQASGGTARTADTSRRAVPRCRFAGAAASRASASRAAIFLSLKKGDPSSCPGMIAHANACSSSCSS